jgi:hypothetical protein
VVCALTLIGTRKLACSKEQGGCARCVREGISCVYSEQKPIGRPRKRQCAEGVKDNTTLTEIAVPDFDSLDGFDYFEGVNVADAFSKFSNSSSINLTELLHEQPILLQDQSTVSAVHPTHGVFGFPYVSGVGRIEIDFGSVNVQSNGSSMSYGSSETTPQTPPSESRGHLFAGEQPLVSAPGPPCSCLATIYVALSSLQTFSPVIETALSTVRGAANAAQAAIRCERCNAAIENGHASPEGYQNTMLLGTLLPLIVNGYKRLLLMVDAEADSSSALGIRKAFSIKAYGGMPAAFDDPECGAALYADLTAMEPMEWRTAVRALLRADVYGDDEGGEVVGLKGMIAELEGRQRRRHRIQGLPDSDPSLEAEYQRCFGERNALCLRIIETAKVAMQGLVIA